MAQAGAQPARRLVPDRRCGACTACCEVPSIELPELHKPAGRLCPHCVLGQGCTIYAARPALCRNFYCAWRWFDWIAAGLRPDLSGVLVCATEQEPPAGYLPGLSLDVALLTPTAWQAAGLAETLGHAIRAGVATYLCLSAAAGRAPERVLLLNEDLQDAAGGGDSVRLLREFRKLHQFATILREVRHHHAGR